MLTLSERALAIATSLWGRGGGEIEMEEESRGHRHLIITFTGNNDRTVCQTRKGTSSSLPAREFVV
jgi:hypothetical protein